MKISRHKWLRDVWHVCLCEENEQILKVTWGQEVTSKHICHLHQPSKYLIMKYSWWTTCVKLDHYGAISIKMHSHPHLCSQHPSIPFLGQQRHILLVQWKILIALIKKVITPWGKFSLSAFTLYSDRLSAICPFLFIHTLRWQAAAPAAFAKTRSRALTSRQIITVHHTSIMLLNSQKGVQASNWTPQLIHYCQGN